MRNSICGLCTVCFIYLQYGCFFILFYANLIFKLSPECSHFLAPWSGFSMIPLAPMCDSGTSPKNMTDRYTQGEMGPLSFELTTKLSVMIAKSLANSKENNVS